MSLANQGEAAARVAAIEVALDHLLDDRPEIPVLLLEPALVLGQELVEMMKEHPVEDRAFGMSGPIDSRHGGKTAPRIGPRSWVEPSLPGKRWLGRRRERTSGRESPTGVENAFLQ
jgi:hypothetical protein